MVNIHLKTLQVSNFKGIKDLTIDFGETTNIYGENATGKTSIFDAFYWLLFDKNSSNSAKFDLKPLDEEGKEIHFLDTKVIGEFEVNGKPLLLSKTLSEKWIKKRGQKDQEFSGNETAYEIDGVPKKLKDYQEEVKKLADETVFKLLTNPLQFGLNTEWKERREILMKILGEPTSEEIIKANEDLTPLLNKLESQKIEDVILTTKATIKKLKTDINDIPIKINENASNVIEKDFENIKAQREEKQVQLENLTEITSDTAVIEKRNLLRKEKEEIQQEYDKESRKFIAERQKLTEEGSKNFTLARAKVTSLEEKIKISKLRIDEINNKLIPSLEEEKNSYATEWKSLNATKKETNSKIFDENSLTCPYCGSPYTNDKAEEKKKEFNLEKARELERLDSKLKRVTENGQRVAQEILTLLAEKNKLITDTQTYEIELETAKEESEKAKVEFQEAQKTEIKNERLEELLNSLRAKEEEIKNVKAEEVDTKAIDEQKANLKSEINSLNGELAQEILNRQLLNRINELEIELQTKQERLLEHEQIEFLTEEYYKTMVKLLENKVSDKFEIVRFKLFETQVNGGMKETCQAMIDTNGSLVPFEDANNAAKVAAGIDIINTLTDFYEISAPVFLDNRESVNEIPDTQAQVINLIVSKDKKLKVVNE